MAIAELIHTSRSRVAQNTVALGLLQVANYLIPLLVIPFITRVLGTDAFGRVSYAQNIVTYLTLLVNYGFEYSATRQIALCAGVKEKERHIFWSVIAAKTMLLAVSFVVLGIMMLTWGKVGADGRLYLYTALINIGFVFFPTWYLQGIQDMHKMALVNFIIKLLGAVLVISIIRRVDQYRLYPLLLSLSNVVIGLGSFVYVVHHYQIGHLTITHQGMREVFSSGSVIFLNQFFVSLYTTVNFTLLGLYMSDSDLGIFSGAQRIILAVNACLVMPISTALFPRMSTVYAEDEQAGRHLLRRVLVYSSALALVACIILYIAAPLLVQLLLGASFMASIEPLRWMAGIPLLVMIATILTVQGLYGRGLQRYAPFVGLVLAITCITTNLYLIPHIGCKGAIGAWILAELLEIIIVGSILLYQRKCST